MYTMKKQLYIFSLLIIIVFFSCGKSEATPDRDDPANDEFSIKDQIAKATFVKSIEYDTLINLHAGVRQVNLQLRTTSSQPIALYVVEVDLKHPDIAIRVGMPDDGDAFKLQTVQAISEANDKAGNRVIAAVNADFFYWTGEPWGPVVKQGNILKQSFYDTWHGFFAIDKDKNPRIGSSINFLDTYPLQEAVGAVERLINNGVKFNQGNPERHPRTMIGYTKDNVIYMVVVDGRQPAHSIGMTFAELSEVMFALKVQEAINLDGGGSSTLVVKNSKTNSFEVKNKYSDAVPRAVANALTVVDLSAN